VSCSDCVHFAQNPNWGGYRAGCLECCARSIAQSPAFHDALMDRQKGANGFPPRYKEALQRAFRGDWQTFHVRVKHYAGLIEKAKVEA